MQMLGLALMVGGMLALGAFTAPVVFGQFPREAAGHAMAIIFRRYDIVLMVSLGLVLLGEWLRGFVLKGKLAAVRYALMIALTGMLLYSTQVVNGDIERMNQAGIKRDYLSTEGRRFEQAHKLSECLYKAQLLVAILLILLTPFASTARTVKSAEGEQSSC